MAMNFTRDNLSQRFWFFLQKRKILNFVTSQCHMARLKTTIYLINVEHTHKKKKRIQYSFLNLILIETRRCNIIQVCQGANPAAPPMLTWTKRFLPLLCLFGFLTSSSATKPTADGSQDWRLTILSAAPHKTERGDHDFCLSRSHYTDQ